MKRIMFLMLSISVVMSSFGTSAFAQENGYIEEFVSSEAFSVTSNEGPWYYYAQQVRNNIDRTGDGEALTRLLGNGIKPYGADLENSSLKDKVEVEVRVNTVDGDIALPTLVGSTGIDFGSVGSKIMSPEAFWNYGDYTFQVMKAWEAPYDCVVDISAQEALQGVCGRGGRGYGDRRIRIMKNNPSNSPENVEANKIWPENEDWKVINGIESFDFTDIKDVNFKKGDMIFFIVDNNDTVDNNTTVDGVYQGKYNDELLWDPVIRVKSKTELYSPISENFDASSTGGLENADAIALNSGVTFVATDDGYAFTPNAVSYEGIYYGNTDLGESQIEFDVLSHTQGTLFLCIHAPQAMGGTGYETLIASNGAVTFRKSNNSVVQGNAFGSGLYPHINGTVPKVLESDYTSKPFHVALYARDNNVKLYINNTLVASVYDDTPISSGYIGFRSYGAKESLIIDNVKVSAEYAPHSITGMIFTSDAEGTTELSGNISDYAGNVIYANLNVENVFDEPKRFSLITALYDSKGNLINCNIGNNRWTEKPSLVWSSKIARGAYSMQNTVDLTQYTAEELAGAKVKLFLWDGTDSGYVMMPYIKSVSYPSAN